MILLTILNIICKLKESFEIPVLPTFRPDNIVKTEDPEKLNLYIQKLEQASEY